MVFINDKWLTLEKELGQGEFGSVLRGIYRPPNEAPVREANDELLFSVHLVLLQPKCIHGCQ